MLLAIAGVVAGTACVSEQDSEAEFLGGAGTYNLWGVCSPADKDVFTFVAGSAGDVIITVTGDPNSLCYVAISNTGGAIWLGAPPATGAVPVFAQQYDLTLNCGPVGGLTGCVGNGAYSVNMVVP